MALMELKAAAGVHVLSINSLGLAWTRVLSGCPEPQMQAHGGPQGRSHHSFPVEILLSIEIIQIVGQISDDISSLRPKKIGESA